MYATILKTDPYREPSGTPTGGRFAKNPDGNSGEVKRDSKIDMDVRSSNELSDLAKKITPEMLHELTTNSSKLLKAGDKFIALRLTNGGNGGNELAGCNAGNIQGIKAHVTHHDEDAGSLEDHHNQDNRRIYVHEVTCTKDMTNDYKALGNNGSGDHNNDAEAIGKDHYFFGMGYSFPTNGDGFKSKSLGELPMTVSQISNLNTKLKDKYYGASDPGVIIERMLLEKNPNYESPVYYRGKPEDIVKPYKPSF